MICFHYKAFLSYSLKHAWTVGPRVITHEGKVFMYCEKFKINSNVFVKYSFFHWILIECFIISWFFVWDNGNKEHNCSSHYLLYCKHKLCWFYGFCKQECIYKYSCDVQNCIAIWGSVCVCIYQSEAETCFVCVCQTVRERSLKSGSPSVLFKVKNFIV